MGSIEIRTEDLKSVAQAASETNIPRPTLYRWIDENKVKAVKIGGVIFIPTSEVERIKKELVNEKAPGD